MKIEIRHAEPVDYKAIHAIFTQPNVVRGTLQLPYSTAERYRDRLAQPRDGVYSLVACVDGEVIGTLGLDTNPGRARRKHVGSLGMGVHDAWQGKGVGTALMQAALELADRWLDLRRLELEVFVDNEGAIRLYKKFGFDIEGTLRQFAFRDGQYVDVYVMGRLRPD